MYMYIHAFEDIEVDGKSQLIPLNIRKISDWPHTMKHYSEQNDQCSYIHIEMQDQTLQTSQKPAFYKGEDLPVSGIRQVDLVRMERQVTLTTGW